MMNPHPHPHPQQKNGSCKPRMLKVAIWIMGLCLAAYIVGPPLYWHTNEALARRFSCPPCFCDCFSQSLSEGLNISSFTECMKSDPDISEEMEKNIINQLSEELKLREAEALENQQLADKTLLEAKKMASQYQKEADKCNSGMGTCEEARAKAEEALNAQKEITAMWVLRARHKGWRDGGAAIRSHVKVFNRARTKIDTDSL